MNRHRKRPKINTFKNFRASKGPSMLTSCELRTIKTLFTSMNQFLNWSMNAKVKNSASFWTISGRKNMKSLNILWRNKHRLFFSMNNSGLNWLIIFYTTVRCLLPKKNLRSILNRFSPGKPRNKLMTYGASDLAL